MQCTLAAFLKITCFASKWNLLLPTIDPLASIPIHLAQPPPNLVVVGRLLHISMGVTQVQQIPNLATQPAPTQPPPPINPLPICKPHVSDKCYFDIEEEEVEEVRQLSRVPSKGKKVCTHKDRMLSTICDKGNQMADQGKSFGRQGKIERR